MRWWAFITYWVPILFFGVALCVVAALAVGMFMILFITICG